MYHIFHPECQTQLGRIEQFEMGGFRGVHPRFFGRHAKTLERTHELVPAIRGRVRRGQQRRDLARLDGGLYLGRPGDELPGFAGNAQRIEQPFLEPPLRQCGKIVRYLHVGLEALGEGLAAHRLRHRFGPERNPDATALGPGIGIGHHFAVR